MSVAHALAQVRRIWYLHKVIKLNMDVQLQSQWWRWLQVLTLAPTENRCSKSVPRGDRPAAIVEVRWGSLLPCQCRCRGRIDDSSVNDVNRSFIVSRGQRGGFIACPALKPWVFTAFECYKDETHVDGLLQGSSSGTSPIEALKGHQTVGVNSQFQHSVCITCPPESHRDSREQQRSEPLSDTIRGTGKYW